MANNEVISMLEEFQKINKTIGEEYRALAYTRAIASIKKINYDITLSNVREVKNLRGVGESIAGKIQELLSTGDVRELSLLKNSPRVRAHRELSKILGVGPETIKRWISQGITSLGTLRKALAKNKVFLNPMQRYGLIYYTDLNTSIPRAEVKLIGDVVQRIYKQQHPDGIFTIAGSYRRGAAESNDVDILLSDANLKMLVAALQDDPNFIDILISGASRVTFLYKRDRVRQVDLTNSSRGSYHAALLHSTGSFEFNEKMRGIAKSRGYKLNQFGLYRQTPNRTWKLIPTSSERDIFAAIGMDYVEPVTRGG